jgi:hypothetical protein
MLLAADPLAEQRRVLCGSPGRRYLTAAARCTTATKRELINFDDYQPSASLELDGQIEAPENLGPSRMKPNG